MLKPELTNHYERQDKINADINEFLARGGTIKRHKIKSVSDIKDDFVPKYKDLAKDKAVEICMRLKKRGLNNLTIAQKMACSTREVNNLMRLGGRRDNL
jgi:glycyl-tRNA synthetase beta subunit